MSEFLDNWLKKHDAYSSDLKQNLEYAEDRAKRISTDEEAIASARKLLTKVNSSNNRVKHLKHMLDQSNIITIRCQNTDQNGRLEHNWKPVEIISVETIRRSASDPVKSEIYARMINDKRCYDCAEKRVTAEKHAAEEQVRQQKKREKEDAVRSKVQKEIEGIVTYAPEGSPGYYCAKLANGKILYFNSILNIAGVRDDKS
jgi:hypothetical protein